jgi:two-component system, NtrC family, response regulator AtoC
MNPERSVQRWGAKHARRTPRVLMVDDEIFFAKAVCKRLEKAGYACTVAASLGAARRDLAEQHPDLVLLDMRLPDGSGLDLLTELRERRASDVPVVVLTAHGELEDAVAAMKLQACDYLKKPIDLDELLLTLDKVLDQVDLTQRLAYSRERESRSLEMVQFVGESPSMREVHAQIERIAHIARNPDVIPPTVLILGETGTGKDMAARLLHQVSARRDRPFVHVDCGTLPAELIEAELFGHEKGAFTQAHAARPGLIEAAEDGTVFLDEVGELPLDLQTKLLALLGRRMVRRLGSTEERPVPAWFIAATNRDVDEMVQGGGFRSDLYYRLDELNLRMPPLRERGDDVVLLARHVVEQTARRYRLAEPDLASDALSALRGYSWPGNVRELQHLLERAVLLSGGARIEAADLGLKPTPAPAVDSEALGGILEGLTLEQAEAMLIECALKRTRGNVSEAARQLGTTRMALRYRMQKHGFSSPAAQPERPGNRGTG